MMKNITIDEGDWKEIRRLADDWQEPQRYVVHRLVQLGLREERLHRKRREYARIQAALNVSR